MPVISFFICRGEILATKCSASTGCRPPRSRRGGSRTGMTLNAVIESCAESPLGYHPGEVPVGRSDDAISASTSSVPPAAGTCALQDRRSLICTIGLISPISSRKIVPSRQPLSALSCSYLPGDAPRMCPNSSERASFSGSVATISATKGPPLRAERT